MRENFFWHKVHSLTGIIPVGYYLFQHLLLNTWSLGGAAKFDGVIGFFGGMPLHFFLALSGIAIGVPLLFHAVYGLFITARATPNLTPLARKYRENWYFNLQRVTGIFVFLFLCYHVTTTTVNSLLHGEETIKFASWVSRLSEPYGTHLVLVVYILGVALASYHLGFGIWNFCIRWGITVSEKAQATMGKVSIICAVGITLMGWVALAGFFFPIFQKPGDAAGATAQQPAVVSQTAMLSR